MLKLSGAVIVVLLVVVGVTVLGHSLTDSSSPAVFEGVTTSDLAAPGIAIINPNPIDHATVPRDTATRSVLGHTGVTVESSQLVRVHLATREAIPPPPSGDFLAWAIRLDTSRAGNEQFFGRGLWFNSSANPTILFVDADTGDYLREFFVTATLSPVRSRP